MDLLIDFYKFGKIKLFRGSLQNSYQCPHAVHAKVIQRPHWLNKLFFFFMSTQFAEWLRSYLTHNVNHYYAHFFFLSLNYILLSMKRVMLYKSQVEVGHAHGRHAQVARVYLCYDGCPRPRSRLPASPRRDHALADLLDL